MSDFNKERKNLWLTSDLWGRIQQAAREASAAEGKNISASEWVRIACEEKLEREDRNG